MPVGKHSDQTGTLREGEQFVIEHWIFIAMIPMADYGYNNSHMSVTFNYEREL
jgi:hypothetical protein